MTKLSGERLFTLRQFPCVVTFANSSVADALQRAPWNSVKESNSVKRTGQDLKCIAVVESALICVRELVPVHCSKSCAK